ncbi:TIGR04325 family methyltransferase [Mucilaginibacter sp. AK015]|uniref:TIGR04325 family methyltransferase n=1 Tax=Mucilaginibacter sp. AK015 TaxID=2723072 RepID=UPI00161E1925|nr:TIGR04325 family methyltransferase [Mucilaginibacter sp. AK015]MBB5395336.1 putative methyltransferase (TIGR04325 family) [Mucilaginibacter sp. AK015]
MPSLKDLIRSVTPPAILKIYRGRKNSPHTGMWHGNYPSWQQAAALCDGYDDKLILEKCKNALLQVKNGEAAYERDSVVFDEVQYSEPLIAALQNLASANGKLCVLDFGGSLGSTYFQNAGHLKHVKNLQWCIVEQGHFVECGKEYFESGQLKFYASVEECMQEQKPDALLLSSVLQYLPEPYLWIKKLIALNIPDIIIDRTSFIQSPAVSRITVQNVPPEIYEASYPCWFFNEQEFLKAFSATYSIGDDFDSFADPAQTSHDGLKMYWKGYILKHRN